jgi:NADPH2:quinone reductase
MVADTMRAVRIREPGGPEVLEPCRIPTPIPAAEQVSIRVAAAGVNRPDVLQRRGLYPPPPGASALPGLEVAGTIEAVGEGVDPGLLGREVCALIAGGGYAEHAVAPLAQCLPIPRGLTAREAAGIPETFFTVWTNLFERGRLAANEAVLVHGGGSGIGTTAIQLARARGARVFVTASGPRKCAACVALGAERAIDREREDFRAAIAEATGGRGVDVVLDMVGGDWVGRNLQVLAPEGRHVSIAFVKGSAANIDLFTVMSKRLTLTGSTLRARSVAEKGRIAQALLAEVWPLLESGRVRPVIDRSFPLEEAAEAHRYLDSGQHFGKVLLTP